MLAMGGESLRKGFADVNWKRELGRLIERAIQLAPPVDDEPWTRQKVAFALGYEDPSASAVSRWINGTEVAPLARFLSVPELRRGFLVALAETSGDDVEVRTVVTVAHVRRAANA